MVERPAVLTTRICECGEEMHQRQRGWFTALWRFECLCGRCGVWRRYLETRLAGQKISELRPISDKPKPKG